MPALEFVVRIKDTTYYMQRAQQLTDQQLWEQAALVLMLGNGDCFHGWEGRWL